jgi:hypothetical protein
VPAEIVPDKKIDLGKNIENSSGTGFRVLSAENIFAPKYVFGESSLIFFGAFPANGDGKTKTSGGKGSGWFIPIAFIITADRRRTCPSSIIDSSTPPISAFSSPLQWHSHKLSS